MKPALNVVTVCTGGNHYRHHNYVGRMRSMLDRHISQPFDFYCITDDDGLLPNVQAIHLAEVLPGWWNKLYQFKPGILDPDTLTLYLDLDQVVLKDLDYLIKQYEGGILCYADHIEWHGCRFGSAFMLYKPADYGYLWQNFGPDVIPFWDQRGGDQAYIGVMAKNIQYLEDKLGYRPALSYRFDSLYQRIPDADTFLVNFHGRPKPHEVADSWVKDLWK